MHGQLVVWSIIVAYIALIFWVGVSKARNVGNTDDFLVAGRNVGWFFLFCTMGATVIGGGASIGAIGKTFDWGLTMVLVSTGWYIHFIFSGLFVAPKFRDAKLYTVAGYFGHRFGEGPRFVTMLLSLLFSVFIVAAQMAAFGHVLAAILPEFADAQTALRWAIVIGGAIVVVYSTAGGLLAVIYTDVYQFVILILGFLLTLCFCLPDIAAYAAARSPAHPPPAATVAHLDETAPLDAPLTAASAQDDPAVSGQGRLATAMADTQRRVPDWFFRPAGNKGWIFLITTFLAFLLGETFAPGYATRYCVGRNIRETKRGIAGVGLFLALIFPAILFGIALYARIHFPDIAPQQALPMVVRQLNHPLISALIIGALLMAVMSSADSALNSATAIFVKDLFEHQLGWADRGDGHMLRLARICSAGLGAAAILVAVLWTDIIDLLLFTYHVWAPAIIVPVCVGVFTRRRSQALTRNILATMLTATAATMIYRFLPVLKARLHWMPLGEAAYLWMGRCDPSVFGVFVAAATFALLDLRSRLTASRGSPAR
jgi:SSS family solute:Na+ symporter